MYLCSHQAGETLCGSVRDRLGWIWREMRATFSGARGRSVHRGHSTSGHVCPPDHAIHPSRVKQKRGMVPTPLAGPPLAHPIIRSVWLPNCHTAVAAGRLGGKPSGDLRKIFLGPAFTDDIDGSVLRLFINAAYILPDHTKRRELDAA